MEPTVAVEEQHEKRNRADRSDAGPIEKRTRGERPEAAMGIGPRVLDLIASATGTHFVPFTASLKTLYSDFVVREIPVADSTTGNAAEPLRLKSLVVPPEARDTVATDGADAATELTSESVAAAFAPLLGDEAARGLWQFVSDSASPRFDCGVVAEKEKRTKVHQAVKAILGVKFISSTSDATGSLVIERATKGNTTRRDREQRNAHRGQFLHFTLYKENIDSNAALRHVATKVGINVRQLLFCGTKDKRAVTLQRVAIKDFSAQRLEQINRVNCGMQSTVKVGDFEYKNEGLDLGKLGGNHFTIALRLPNSNAGAQSTTTVESLQAACDQLRRYGCVNYFGPQRFGTTSVLTSDVGRAILRGDFAEAVRLIFKSKVEFTPTVAAAYGHVCADPPNFAAALAAIPHYCYQEKDLLRHLAEAPNDFIGALMRIPRTMLMMYCHSAQSLAWNVMASKRIAAKCDGVMVGDLVLAASGDGIAAEEAAADEAADIGPDDAQADGTAAEGTAKGGHLPTVRVVTADDVANGMYTIFDVVVPVPGTDAELRFPEGEGHPCNRAAFVQTMHTLGVEGLLDSSHVLAKQLHFHGTYRRLMLRPADLSLELREVEGPRTPVVTTDLQLIRPPRAKPDASNSSSAAPVAEAKAAAVAAPLCKVVVAQFSLPAGCYATSLLREICAVSNE